MRTIQKTDLTKLVEDVAAACAIPADMFKGLEGVLLVLQSAIDREEADFENKPR